ncbi:hypothetical protein MMC13_001254 [Lambiella insularis]|nr:hypothetical protein [Lambiella insularis]
MPRILLFGSGSIGTMYAFILTRAGADVTCVCRSNYTAAKQNGFTIQSTIFGDHTFHPNIVPSVTDASSIGVSYDYVVICSKSSLGTQPTTASLIAPAVTPTKTSIVIIQNGLGVEAEFHSAFPSNPIISGVAYLPTTQIAPTRVSHTETELLHLGTFPAESEPSHQTRSVKHFAELITAGGATSLVHHDVQIQRWSKLVANAALNPICALSRCRDQELIHAASASSSSSSSPNPVDGKGGAELIRGVMCEVVAVAAAVGYGEWINERTVEKQFARTTDRKFPGVEPSMLADLKGGKKLEVESIVGEVVRVGRRERVKIERLEMLYCLLCGLDWARGRERQG